MRSDLETVLSESGKMLDDALVRAREELTELNARRAQLEALIAQAEAVQRLQEGGQPTARSLTLHEAMSLVLRNEGNRWMSARELADAVNLRALYHKKDRSPVEANQIQARTKNYAHMFEKDGPRIRLRLQAIGDEK